MNNIISRITHFFKKPEVNLKSEGNPSLDEGYTVWHEISGNLTNWQMTVFEITQLTPKYAFGPFKVPRGAKSVDVHIHYGHPKFVGFYTMGDEEYEIPEQKMRKVEDDNL